MNRVHERMDGVPLNRASFLMVPSSVVLAESGVVFPVDVPPDKVKNNMHDKVFSSRPMWEIPQRVKCGQNRTVLTC